MDAFDLLFAAYEDMRGHQGRGDSEAPKRKQGYDVGLVANANGARPLTISGDDFDEAPDNRQAESDQYAQDIARLQNPEASALTQDAQARVQLSRRVFANELPAPLEPGALEFPDADFLQRYKEHFQ